MGLPIGVGLAIYTLLDNKTQIHESTTALKPVLAQIVVAVLVSYLLSTLFGKWFGRWTAE